MRLPVPLISVALFASPLQAQPPATATDARNIMRTVLAFETRVHRDAEVGPPPCVRSRVAPAGLGGSRRSVEEAEAFERRPPPPPGALVRVDPVTVVNSSEIHLSPFRRWQRIPIRNPGYVDDDGPLSDTLEADVRAAERAALIAPRQPRRLAVIDPAWLGEPLAICRSARSLPALEFDSPVIVGDFAFVRADFECVLCGQGIVLVLRRRGADWDLVAAAETWVS